MRRSPDGSRWIFVFYLVLLVWVPIPLGSNRSWSWALLALWTLVLALWWLAGFFRGRHAYPAVLRESWPMLLCGLLWLAYVWLHLVPLPIEVLQLLSPQAARWHIAAAAPAAIDAAPLTLDAYATLGAACRSTAYLAFFALSLILLRDRDRIRYAAYTLIASGVLQALYGALLSLQSPGDVASGTFVNRNHYAGYLTMCLSVGVGVLIASLSGERSQTWGVFFRKLMQWIITPKMALRLGLVVMVVALVLTRSRMGNSSFFISLLVTGVIGLLLAKRATKSMIILLISLVAIDVFIVGTYFGTRRVVERITQTTVESEDRDEVAGYAIDMWKDYPVFGSGPGSFPVVFPRYSGAGTQESYTHAHNDYLEFGAETGVLGLSLLGLMVATSFAAALRAQYLRRDPLMRGLSFAAMMGILALMIHSGVDFNLQIPANALTFMLLLAFAWISLYHARAEA
ncbi:MAG: O-antigen ligase family protein [Burkholderiales bacterium]|nr:O-antigen ligase family protein [Burkholderiales bacterium]